MSARAWQGTGLSYEEAKIAAGQDNVRRVADALNLSLEEAEVFLKDI